MVKGTSNLSFKYDDAGIRTQKTVNGVTTKYYLNGDKVTLEDNGTDKIYYTYDSTGDLVSMSLNGVEYFYIRNAQGDVMGLWDKAGTEVVTYSYDSWGKVISTTGSLASTVGEKNPYEYRGYRYDSETGLYYLQSRYYNPDWGRFINADAEGGKVGDLLSHNVFAYALNNPASMSDSDGFRPDFGDGTGRETTEELSASLAYMRSSYKTGIYSQEGLVSASKETDLGKGWESREDGPSNEAQRHMHVYGPKGKHWAQNENGSVHDKKNNSPGQPPKKVLKELKRKNGWDWERKMQPSIQFDDGSRMPFPFLLLPMPVSPVSPMPVRVPIPIFP